PDATYVAEVSLWSAVSAERPRATVRYIRLRDRLAFAHALTLEEITREWRNIADSARTLEPTAQRQSRIGPVRYAEASTDRGPCLVFVADTHEDKVERSRSRAAGDLAGTLDRAGCHDHAEGLERPGGDRRRKIADAVDLIGEIADILDAKVGLMSERHLRRPAHHQMGFDRHRLQHLEKPHAVNHPGGAAQADD